MSVEQDMTERVLTGKQRLFNAGYSAKHHGCNVEKNIQFIPYTNFYYTLIKQDE